MTSFPRLVAFMTERRPQLLDRLVAEVKEFVPRYELLPVEDFRGSLDGLLGALTELLAGTSPTAVQQKLVLAAERRVSQGFSAADYLRATFVVPTVLQRELRLLLASDPIAMEELERLAPVLIDLTATAGNTFVDRVSRQLQAKNLELNRLNQQLLSHQRALSVEVGVAMRQLAAANEFNRLVIESLSSGLFVTDRTTEQITLFSSRLEEMLGIPSEEALGHTVSDVFARVGGLDLAGGIDQVKQTGSMPLTKLHITLPSGKKKSVYIRAQTLLDETSSAIGTVVVVDDVSERELLLDSFSRYVSKDLVRRLLARAEPLGLEGERRPCTILFADVRGFTTLAEGSSPEELHMLLNVYFRLMIDSILGAGGFIDKFVGDKVMALFTDGTPSEHALAGVRAAEAIKHAQAALNDERRAAGLPALEIGIGVNTGEVLLGNIGSDQRMEFTAIGDPVNVADRLQHMARQGEVLVGDETMRLVCDAFAFTDRGDLSIRGRQAPVRVGQLIIGGT
jgi:PAS domain S-box-containing protein